MDESRKDLSQRVVELEITVSHQQKLLDDLNRVVTEQTMAITKLERKAFALGEEAKRLRESLDSQTGNLPNEKPPHY